MLTEVKSGEKVEERKYVTLNNLLNIPSKDGAIQIDKDKEAVNNYFLNHVNPNTVFFHSLKEKLGYLIENKYIDGELLKPYTFEQIKSVYRRIYDKKFRFNTFMGAFKFYNQYALKTNDGKRYLERYEDRLAMNALVLAGGDYQLALDLADELINRRLQPATPTFLNVGRVQRGEYVSCFLISNQDSMNSIRRTVSHSLHLSKIGGGVGINLTNLREAKARIQRKEGLASGVVPVMKIFEDVFTYANQLGQRAGAGAVYLSVHHPDIIDFLAVRKENAEEKVRIKTLSLGLLVTDKYYESVAKNDYLYTFSPVDVEEEYGKPMSQVDITANYQDMIDNPNIRKKRILARELEEEISKLQGESGYPYVINIDVANESNPIHGMIEMSNLCTEIFQVTSHSKINDDLSYERVGQDISCNLATTNIVNMMKSPDFGKSIINAYRSLLWVSKATDVKGVPTVSRGNKDYRSVGLGAMNLHGFLAQNKMQYGEYESLDFVNIYMMLMNYWTIKASMEEVKQGREKPFYEFELSDYANGKYLTKYKERLAKNGMNFAPKTDKVSTLFKDIWLPTEKDWEELMKEVEKYGMASAYRLAIAPNGSISYVNEATASIHPIVQRVEERLEGTVGRVYCPAPNLSSETIPYYRNAYETDMRKMIDLYAIAQIHVDQGISCTLFFDNEVTNELYEWKEEDGEHAEKKTTRDLSIIRNYARMKGLKSLYYIRTYEHDSEGGGVQECESCQV